MYDSDPQEGFVVSEREDECVFRKEHERRACGPDGLKALLCSAQLHLFCIVELVLKGKRVTTYLENIRNHSCSEEMTS